MNAGGDLRARGRAADRRRARPFSAKPIPPATSCSPASRDRAQLRALTDELRAIPAATVPISIDQEGGRVARMRPPEWDRYPAGGLCGCGKGADERDRGGAGQCRGDRARCSPRPGSRGLLAGARRSPAGAHDMVGDRALGSEPMQVAALGRAMLDGSRAAGWSEASSICRATAARGSTATRNCRWWMRRRRRWRWIWSRFVPCGNAPMGMVAHIVFTAWDSERPSSQSPFVIEGGDPRPDRLRRLPDDGRISACALCRAISRSGTRRAIEAGCDAVLHCSGAMEEMVAVASAAGTLGEKGCERLARAMAQAGRPTGSYEALAAKKRQSAGLHAEPA